MISFFVFYFSLCRSKEGIVRPKGDLAENGLSLSLWVEDRVYVCALSAQTGSSQVI